MTTTFKNNDQQDLLKIKAGRLGTTIEAVKQAICSAVFDAMKLSVRKDDLSIVDLSATIIRFQISGSTVCYSLHSSGAIRVYPSQFATKSLCRFWKGIVNA